MQDREESRPLTDVELTPPPWTRRDSFALSGIVALGAVLRIGYLVVFTGSRKLVSDGSQYVEIAKNLATGHGYSMQYPQLVVHETAFRPPDYPLFLAGFYWIFGPSAGLARALNIVLGLAMIALAYWTVWRYVSTRAAIGAGIALAVMPNLIANDTYPLEDTLSLIIILLLINAVLRRRWILTGVLTGLLTLSRPSAQFLIVLVVVWVLVHANWKKALTVAGVFALVLTPWLVRNWVQIGEPVLVTSNGFNWAAMYSPPAQANHGFVDPVFHPYFEGYRLAQFNELTWNNELQALGVRSLKSNPTYVVHVAIKNAGDLLELTPSDNVFGEGADGRSLGVRDATLWIFYVELVIGLFGLLATLRRQISQLLLAQGLYFFGLSLLFIPAPRLRAPLDLALGVGVGLALEKLAARREAVSQTAAGHEPIGEPAAPAVE